VTIRPLLNGATLPGPGAEARRVFSLAWLKVTEP